MCCLLHLLQSLILKPSSPIAQFDLSHLYPVNPCIVIHRYLISFNRSLCFYCLSLPAPIWMANNKLLSIQIDPKASCLPMFL
ncbi:hypothetical protein CPB86DRAFT_573201 [Serendipita vermifera]|nr:hypothetical protein CPB86DRAFT_573201 [Serendipita vermifera]